MELTLKQLQQSVAQNEILFHNEKNENNAILKEHEVQIDILNKNTNQLRIELDRLDLVMGAYKDLEERITNLEAIQIDEMEEVDEIKPKTWLEKCLNR